MPKEKQLKFFLSRNELGISLQEITTNWFKLYTGSRNPIELWHSILRRSDLWVHLEFLLYTQVIEGLYRDWINE